MNNWNVSMVMHFCFGYGLANRRLLAFLLVGIIVWCQVSAVFSHIKSTLISFKYVCSLSPMLMYQIEWHYWILWVNVWNEGNSYEFQSRLEAIFLLSINSNQFRRWPDCDWDQINRMISFSLAFLLSFILIQSDEIGDWYRTRCGCIDALMDGERRWYCVTIQKALLIS